MDNYINPMDPNLHLNPGYQLTATTSTTACTNPEHNPPVLLTDGPFSHRCPACGYSITVAIGPTP